MRQYPSMSDFSVSAALWIKGFLPLDIPNSFDRCGLLPTALRIVGPPISSLRIVLFYNTMCLIRDTIAYAKRK